MNKKQKQKQKQKQKLINERQKIGEKLYNLQKNHIKNRAYYEKRDPLLKKVLKIQKKLKQKI